MATVSSRRSYEFGRADEATHPDSMRATLAEFLSTFLFVFAAEGSVLAVDKLSRGSGYAPPGYSTGFTAGEIVLVALAHAFALFAAVSACINISGGHVNPAITLGTLLAGRISFIRTVYYWVAQILGAILASLLLRLVTAGMRPIGLHTTHGEGVGHALLLEIILTYALVYTFYATAVDPKRGNLGIIAPLAIALIYGANVMVGAPFDGASMNPARAFGPALVGWRWKDHWIYWVGPFIGGALGALVYEFLLLPTEPPHHPTHQPLAAEDY